MYLFYLYIALADVAQFNTPSTTDSLVSSTFQNGPLLSRMALSGELEQPMFTVSLQRDTIDISGTGKLTIGKLPDGVDNSSLTWVPVRLYKPADGGLQPPSFAPQEVSILFIFLFVTEYCAGISFVS